MSTRNLNFFIQPKSVAVIGASNKLGSVGAVLIENIKTGGFSGRVFPVNPKHQTVSGLKCYPSVTSIPEAPDLAIIATPPETVPPLISELGKKGTRAVVVITAGFAEGGRQRGIELQQSLLQAARPYDLRIIGPNCLGIQVPGANLNASFGKTKAGQGRTAFATQSGAMATAIVDWAVSRGIGFSRIFSLGDMADVDFGDTLEFLASDEETQAVLLYMEAVTVPQKFMAAARAAALKKPVIVVKAGRVPEGAKAATSHTGALAGSDAVYSAVFRRTGLLRVMNLEELFEAAESLSKITVPPGDRLAILTNGGGAGVLATDALIEQGGKLAPLSQSTMMRLNEILPATWSHANPIDIIGDASAERYAKSLESLIADDGVDAVLTLNCPTAIVDSGEVAKSVIEVQHGGKKPVFAVWLGGGTQESARRRFEEAGIPCYDTPEAGVQSFMHLVNDKKIRSDLQTSGSSDSGAFRRDAAQIHEVFDRAIKERREWLSEFEAKRVLAAYDIPTTRTWLAPDAKAAGEIAEQAGGAVVLKIYSPDILHKSDIGGVVLGLRGSSSVQREAESMLQRIHSKQPSARISGFVVEDMVSRPNAVELIIGMKCDPQFGPVILFGEGGIAVEVIGDTALELAPLDLRLAGDLVSRTRVYHKLKGYRNRPAVDFNGLHLSLVKVSRLAVDFPEIVEIDINPLIADAAGVMALDARIRVVPREGTN